MGREQNRGSEPQQQPAVASEPGQHTEQEPAGSSVETGLQQFLTEQQLQILAFEKKFFKYAGVKERAITQELGITPVQYYQQVAALIEHPGAYAAEPMLIARLQELRDVRQRRRAF